MGRVPKIKINATLLDSKIKELEGSSFNQGKISKFVMNKGNTYYCEMLKNQTVAVEVLDRICEYYELDKNDFIITEEIAKKQIQEQANTQNYENLIVLLSGINKTMQEQLAQQKSTNYLLGEIRTSLLNENKNTKSILEKLEHLEKRQSKYNKY